jgi:hypothetical protein
MNTLSVKAARARAYLAAFLFLFPRTPFSYVFYLLVAVIICDVTKRSLRFVACIYGLLLLQWLIIYGLGHDISITAFVIEIVMMLPLLLFLSGQRVNYDLAARFVLNINVLAFVFSIVNMMGEGFPFKLPYIHFLPDFYAAFFGQGGAKIVTIIGFLGLLFSLSVSKGLWWRSLFIVLCTANFLMPSYLIGIFCGVVALFVVFGYKERYFYLMLVVFAGVASYAMTRFSAIDITLWNIYGYHPKLLAYIEILKLYAENIEVIIFGTSAGQFSGVGAQWGSDFLRSMSTHNIPSIPGLSMSYFHEVYLGHFLEVVEDNPWALGSSLNKPYSSLSTILAEFGLFLGGYFIYKMVRHVIVVLGQNNTSAVFTAFGLLIFSIDVWHDNIWFGICLLVAASLEPRTISTPARPTDSYTRLLAVRE